MMLCRGGVQALYPLVLLTETRFVLKMRFVMRGDSSTELGDPHSSVPRPFRFAMKGLPIQQRQWYGEEAGTGRLMQIKVDMAMVKGNHWVLHLTRRDVFTFTRQRLHVPGSSPHVPHYTMKRVHARLLLGWDVWFVDIDSMIVCDGITNLTPDS